MTTIRPRVNSNRGMGGSHETVWPPRKVRVLSNGLVRSRKLYVAAAAAPEAGMVYVIEPRAPNMLELHRAKLTIMAPPQTRARTLMMVPHAPSLNQAPLCGQPFTRAVSTPRLHMK